MSERFGAAAQRHFGLAARLLGWRPLDFWNATPAELVAALVPADGATTAPLDRADLARLMEEQT